MNRLLSWIALCLGLSSGLSAKADLVEIYCDIRDSGDTLSCHWNGKEKKMMSADEIPAFVDMADQGAYITLKSKKGYERTFMVDGNAPQYKKLRDLKKRASISEISKLKTDLFSEIEKKLIRIAGELDVTAEKAELIKYDPSVANDKLRRESKFINSELEAYRKNKEKVCTATPEFERMSKSNMALQSTLSNIILAFQSPQSCLSDMKLAKDKDGSVDLRQLDGIEEKFLSQCKRR